MPNHQTRKPGILIYGAGGHAKVVWSTIVKMGVYEVVAYLVDRDPLPQEEFLGAPVLNAPLALLDANLPRRIALGIGDNAQRQVIGQRVEAAGFEMPVIIHPMVAIGENVTFGAGTLVCSATIIDPDVTIGKGNILNSGCAIGHDSRTEDYVHICGGTYIGGRCQIKELSFVSLRAIVLPGLIVGRNSQVGAGSMLTKDLPDDHIALGSPARFRLRSGDDS